MNYITPNQLSQIYGGTPSSYDKWIEPLNKTMEQFEINNKNRIACFLAQIGHESNRLTAVEENLNYSANALTITFKRYFPTLAIAILYARNQSKIANKTYANRYGNGDELSGDGWKYKGKGLIQITFKDNYKACGDFLSVDLVSNPDLLKNSLYAALSAGWYWKTRNLNKMADEMRFDSITKAINGGLNGKDDRDLLLKKALSILV